MYHRFRRHWRHFRPHISRRGPREALQYKRRDITVDRQHLLPREVVPFVCDTTDLFDCAEQVVAGMLQRRPEVHDLDRDIDRLRKRFARSGNAYDGLVALLAQAPRASLAQIQMEQHAYGYRNRRERLFELIDFNDTFVDTVQVVNDHDRRRFGEATKVAADRICKRVGAPCFTNEQWDAIVRGLTREVAVYWAAVNNGLNATMTSRSQDALGIDLQVQDPETGRYINLDVKTPSSFRHRLEQLVREKRLTEHELLEADQRSYAVQHNGHGIYRATIILLCILPDLFGDFEAFRLVNEAPMRDKLNQLIREHGLTDGKYGKIDF